MVKKYTPSSKKGWSVWTRLRPPWTSGLAGKNLFPSPSHPRRPRPAGAGSRRGRRTANFGQGCPASSFLDRGTIAAGGLSLHGNRMSPFNAQSNTQYSEHSGFLGTIIFVGGPFLIARNIENFYLQVKPNAVGGRLGEIFTNCAK